MNEYIAKKNNVCDQYSIEIFLFLAIELTIRIGNSFFVDKYLKKPHDNTTYVVMNYKINK